MVGMDSTSLKISGHLKLRCLTVVQGFFINPPRFHPNSVGKNQVFRTKSSNVYTTQMLENPPRFRPNCIEKNQLFPTKSLNV